jgi:acetylornithine deacetylase/succinyl-diaminopimelate desuccinylase-like protein
VRELVESHARARGYFIVDREPTPAERMAHAKILKMIWEPGYPATRAAMDAPVSRAVLRAGELALGKPIIAVPILGGSLPMNTFAEVLRVPLIVVPIVNHDNNQHAANENLRLQNLWDGIQLYGGLLAQLGKQWGTVTP